MTKFRQVFYLGSGAVAGILPLLLFFKLIDSGQAASITDLVGSLGSLLGAGAAITAGTVLGKQRKEGTLETPSVTDIVQASVDARAKIDADLKQVTDLIGSTPVLGPIATQAINSLRI